MNASGATGIHQAANPRDDGSQWAGNDLKQDRNEFAACPVATHSDSHQQHLWRKYFRPFVVRCAPLTIAQVSGSQRDDVALLVSEVIDYQFVHGLQPVGQCAAAFAVWLVEPSTASVVDPLETSVYVLVLSLDVVEQLTIGNRKSGSKDRPEDLVLAAVMRVEEVADQPEMFVDALRVFAIVGLDTLDRHRSQAKLP